MFVKLKLFASTIVVFFALFFILTQSVQASTVFVFNKNLQIGNINADVKELQKFLNNNGFIVSKSGVGSLGKESTYFGSATRNALIKFQKANKIIPAVGYFGLVTRKIVNKIESSSAANYDVSRNQVNGMQSANQIENQVNQANQVGLYYIGGSITGITGAVVLQNNSKDDLTIDVGQKSNFTFRTAVADGANYNVTIKSKYSGQTCYVHNNIGIVSGANIDNIKIACGANLSYNPFTFIPSGGGIVSYSLTYTAGTGGTISGTASQTVNSGSSGSAVTAVPDTGYSFVSWSDGVLTAERTDTSITVNKTVSATFELNTYTISFDANGSSGGTKPDDQIKTYGTTLVLATNSGTLVKTGYTFSGWNTLANGTGTDYAAGADYTDSTSTTLFAKWTINTYTITFNTNEGDGGSTAAQTLEYTSTTNLRTNGFTRTGYTFDGWATTTDGAVGYLNGASFTIGAANVTLYAKWTPAIVVGASYQGGKVAYIFQAGDLGYVAGQTHGLIASTANLSTGIIWAKAANQSAAVPGGTLTAIGKGSVNTDNIVAQNGLDDTYAAGLARSYAGGGYSDWYLPSYDELGKLYVNRAAIGGFSNNFYWSSSEVNATLSWHQFFFGGGWDTSNKSATYYVRAVRSF